MTEDEVVGWHHGLYVHEFDQALGDGEGQGTWRCSVHVHRFLDMTGQLN